MIKEDKKNEIIPTISLSDKEFKKKVGPESWEKIKSKTFRDDSFKCQGCGFEAYDVPVEEVLDIHLVEIDENEIINSKFITTCVLCHTIQHADIAIKQNYVTLVNSKFSQAELVNICRNGALLGHIENGDIRYLRKTDTEFLEELRNGSSLEGKVKFIFNENYLKKLGINF